MDKYKLTTEDLVKEAEADLGELEFRFIHWIEDRRKKELDSRYSTNADIIRLPKFTETSRTIAELARRANENRGDLDHTKFLLSVERERADRYNGFIVDLQAQVKLLKDRIEDADLELTKVVDTLPDDVAERMMIAKVIDDLTAEGIV